MTDPPMVGDVALAVARRYRVPLVVVSQDVFPEIAVELKRLTNPVLVGLLRRADELLPPPRRPRRRDRRDDAATARGEGRAPGAAAGDPELGRHGCDPAGAARQRVAREHGLDGRFVVMHSGNIGHAQDLDTLIRASTSLRDLEQLAVVLSASARATQITSRSRDARRRQRLVSRLPASRAALAVALERRHPLRRARTRARRLRRSEPALRNARGRPARARSGRGGQRDGAARPQRRLRHRRSAGAAGPRCRRDQEGSNGEPRPGRDGSPRGGSGSSIRPVPGASQSSGTEACSRTCSGGGEQPCVDRLALGARRAASRNSRSSRSRPPATTCPGLPPYDIRAAQRRRDRVLRRGARADLGRVRPGGCRRGVARSVRERGRRGGSGRPGRLSSPVRSPSRSPRPPSSSAR